jgi:RNA polymerase sigma-70 factor (sigma-E family)
VRVDQREDFDAFVMARYQRLVSLAYSLTGDPHRAEDLVQDALLKAWRAWPRIRQQDPTSYVSTTVARTVYSARRRRWSAESPTSVLPDAGTDAEQERSGDADRLLRALLTLPAQMRAVVVLRYREDLSERAVADTLGCSLGAVKSQASRGLERLRQALSGAEDGSIA